MKKIILGIGLLMGMATTSLSADDRHALRLSVGYVAYDLDKTQNIVDGSVDSTANWGDIDGYEVSGDVIVNDGLMFGNSNYLTVRYENLEGTAELGSGTGSLNSEYEIKTIEVFMTEMELNRDREYFVGIVGGFKTIDIMTDGVDQELDWIDVGVTAGYTEYFFRNFGVGVAATAKIAINPKVKLGGGTDNGDFDLNHVYSYEFKIPLTYKMGSAFALYWDTSYEYYDIGSTDTTRGLSFMSSEMNNYKSIVGFRMSIN